MPDSESRSQQQNPTPSEKTRRQITCKIERDFWDNLKNGAEIIGLLLLAVYTCYTIKMYRANKRAADAAKSAAETAARQLELSERPWVQAQISIAGPFNFNVNGANLHLRFQLLNTGHSPALATVIEGSPVDSLATGVADAAQSRDSVCQGATQTVQRYPGSGVAPSQQRRYGGDS